MREPKDPVVIASAVRTPIGSFQGALSSIAAPSLGAAAIREAVARANLRPEQVDEVIMGCVLPAGLGQAPARQAAIQAGLPVDVPCSTLNKVCGSGMKTVMLGSDLITAGSTDIVIAGGMESMTNAPYLLEKARGGYRAGHGKIYDHMFLDGLEDAYENGRSMGSFAEDTAQHYQFTREQQDEFALRSLSRALRATKDGAFHNEIISLDALDHDEQPTRAKPEKIPLLKPAFREGGTVTAANSSSISDGAAAVALMRLSTAEKLGAEPLAIIRAHASHAQQPAWFTTAPVSAISKLLEKTGWKRQDVDLYEINEAFAVVVMAAMRELDIPADQVNINGGACALGHPIGCSGTRIIATLLQAMKRHQLKRGVASICIGGGEATAIALERI